jgi:WD40 repeat protein
MAFSPVNNLIATSENGNLPKTFIWDGLTMQVKHKIVSSSKPGKNGCVKTMANLAFSPSGTFLVMVAANDDHNLAVYNTDTGAMVAAVKGGREKIVELSWMDDTHFSTVGPKHFRHWTVGAGTIKGAAGAFGKNSNMVGSCAFYGNTCLTGSLSGAVYKWTGASLTGTLAGHTRLVDAIHANVPLKKLFTGGRDGMIIEWNPEANFAEVMKFDMNVTLSTSLDPSPRAIWLTAEGQLYVGTKGAEIF